MPSWGDVLVELQHEVALHQVLAQTAVSTIRHKYLKELHTFTKRNVIAYYSGWLSKTAIAASSINDEDKNGFMMAVHKLDRSKGLDLILHTPGGSIYATQSIVYYLRKMFGNDIRAIVPQIAMSAGTMIACSCKQIIMGKHSNLGPIDPHVNGMPAYGVISEFKKAYEEISKNPGRIAVWSPIISQYAPSFLGQCKNAIAQSNTFVTEQLTDIMFGTHTGVGRGEAKRKAKSIVKALSDFSKNKTHSRHIHFDELEKLGLDIKPIEHCANLYGETDDSKFQDLVLTVHHCYMHTLMNSPAYKIVENHLGAAMIKNQMNP